MPISSGNAGAKVQTTNTKKQSKKTAMPLKKSLSVGDHPTYKDMVAHAIADLADRKGSSRTAILKYIVANNKVGDDKKHVISQLRLSLLREVKSGFLIRTKGTGAAGSFKLAERMPKKAKTLKKTTAGSGDNAKISKKKVVAAKHKSETDGAMPSSSGKPTTPKPRKSKKTFVKPSPKATKKMAPKKSASSSIKKAVAKPKKSAIKKAAASAVTSKTKKNSASVVSA